MRFVTTRGFIQKQKSKVETLLFCILSSTYGSLRPIKVRIKAAKHHFK
nr:MAG TPA: hypothetical protein [Inoviridae sp.]